MDEAFAIQDAAVRGERSDGSTRDALSRSGGSGHRAQNGGGDADCRFDQEAAGDLGDVRNEKERGSRKGLAYCERVALSRNESETGSDSERNYAGITLHRGMKYWRNIRPVAISSWRSILRAERISIYF